MLRASCDLGVELDLHDIAEEPNRAALIERGGKQQVPFFVDEEKGIAMYESDDIVAYLESAKKLSA